MQYYYFSNLHKENSRRIDGKTPPPAEELRRAFAAAKTEVERRDVCLHAIDEGVIQTFGPVSVSTVDAIFGTHLASDLPSRKERTRRAIVDLSGPYPAVASAVEKMTTRDGSWFMEIEYFADGSISSYYVTNLRK